MVSGVGVYQGTIPVFASGILRDTSIGVTVERS
jgi:hypothetical protein